MLVLIQYRSVTATQPPNHVAVAITLNAKASSLKSWYQKQKFPIWVSQIHNNIVFVLKVTHSVFYYFHNEMQSDTPHTRR